MVCGDWERAEKPETGRTKMMRGVSAETFSGYKQRENSIAWNKTALRAKTIQNLGVTAAVLEVSQSVFCSERPLTPAFAAGLERNGKPVRQHALVRRHF